METELYKIRSVQACFRAAYDLFTSNIKTILRKTWIPAMAMSLVIALYDYLSPGNIITLLLGEQQPIQPLTTSLLLIAVFLMWTAASIWLSATFFSLLNGRTRKENGGRLLRATGVFLLIGCIIGIIIGFASIPITLLMVSSLGHRLPTYFFILAPAFLVILCVLVLLPSLYSSFKYIMEPTLKAWSIFGKPYHQGWHHWGFLFVCTLLCFIINSLLGILVQLPSSIMALGKLASTSGTLMGDPDGMPSYFNIAFFVMCSLGRFIWCYLMLWVSTVYYYAYGSIEAKIKGTTQTAE